MGCNEANDKNLPMLICFFEPGNELQKEYCLKLKDNFHHEQSIRYEIKSTSDNPFGVKLNIKGKIIDIQTEFNNSEEEMLKALDAMYKELDALPKPPEQPQPPEQPPQ